MKKKILIVLVFIVIFITSCSIPSDFYEKYDGIPFEKIDSYMYEGKSYDLLLPNKINESLAYYYKNINNKSTKETWIVNYSNKVEYISELYVENSFNDALYNSLLKNENKVEDALGYDIFLYKNDETIILEQSLSNENNEEIGCIIIAEYLPIIAASKDRRYLIFIPINAYICKYKDNCVYDFKGDSILSIEELILKYQILER